MKNLRWIVSFVFLFATTLALAQSYAFKVIVTKGKSEVKSGDTWSPIKVGSGLQPKDEVKIGENSYLGLLHASGKPLELKTAGTYSVTTLSSGTGKDSPVMNKYIDFVLSKEETKKNRLSATGAVHRDLKMPIIVYLPKTGDHMGNTISVNWNAQKITDDFELHVTNLLEEPLAVYPVKNNVHAATINVNEGKMKDFPVLIVFVTSKDGSKSDKYIIKKMDPSRRSVMEISLEEVQPLLADPNPLNKFLLASVYEEKLLLSDALTAYKEAADMAPDVEMYRDAYEQFLKRLGF